MLANNVDSFRDSMNAASIPSSVSNNGTGDQHAFMKELEKKSNRIDQKDSIDTTRQSEPPKHSKTDEPRPEKTEKKHTEKTENRPQTPDRDSDARETPEKSGDKRVEIKPSPQQVKKNVKNGDSSGEMNTVKTARIPKTGKAGDSGSTESTGKTEHNPKEAIKNIKIGNIKEIIQRHQVQSEKLDEAKEDVKEKFSETQRIKSGNTAERVVLKELGGGTGGKETSKTTPDIEVEDVKKNEPSTAEKQQMKSPEVEKKDDPSSFKNELNTAKNKANPDGTFNVGTVNTREAQPVKTEIKIQKLLHQQNIREQYGVIKDNVLNSVDNGIKMMLSHGENRVSIKLHPPELGKIQVELIVKDNHVNARINTENAAVKEVIMANLGQLKSNIENAGITVQKFDVEVGGFRNHFDRQSSDDTSGGNGRGKKEDIELQLPGDPDWLPDKIIRQTSYSYFLGRSINYLV